MLHVASIPSISVVTLNIGLASSLNWGGYKSHGLSVLHKGQPNLVDILEAPYKYAKLLERVRELSIDPDAVQWSVVQSGSEPTLVVKFKAVSRDIVGQAFALSEELKQDCVALWIHNDVNGGIGQLIGRYNYVWGEFKSEYFIHI